MLGETEEEKGDMMKQWKEAMERAHQEGKMGLEPVSFTIKYGEVMNEYRSYYCWMHERHGTGHYCNNERWYKADEVDDRIKKLEKERDDYKYWRETACKYADRLRKALEEIKVEVRKPEKLPRDIEKWLKRADKRTKLKKIDDITTKALKEGEDGQNNKGNDEKW